MNYVTYDEDGNLTGGYFQQLHSAHASNHIEVPEELRRDWLKYRANEARDGVEIIPALVVDLDAAAQAKKDIVTALRWEKETGGTTHGGIQIKTDEASQAKIAGAKLFSDANPAELIDFKASSGWVQVDGATITQIAQAVGVHVQACYTAEKNHHDAIDAIDTIEELADYDITTGWPDN